jgi:hypothetical protein
MHGGCIRSFRSDELSSDDGGSHANPSRDAEPIRERSARARERRLVVGARRATTYISAGPLTFGIEYRHFQNDQGICIHVFGELGGNQEEFLRFDCFDRAPHYHYAWSTKDEYVALDTTADGDPLQWTLECLRTRLPAMLIRAGAGELTLTLDQRDIDAALPTVRGWAESLQTQGRQE